LTIHRKSASILYVSPAKRLHPFTISSILVPGSVLRAPRALCVNPPSNTSSLSSAAPSIFSLFCTKSAILTSSFSNPYALFKKERFANFFTINHFRTLLQNTRSVPASSTQRLPIFSTDTPVRTHSNARNPFPFSRLLHSSLFTHISSLAFPFSPQAPAKPPAAAERRDVLSASALLHRLLRHEGPCLKIRK
jgi:hypothetical protein